MPVITRPLIRRLRAVFSRALGRSRLGQSPVLFRPGRDGLTIGVCGRDVSVEYRSADLSEGASPAEPLAVPLEFLKSCEGARDEPVVLEPLADAVTVRWADGGVPQNESFPRHEPFDLPPRPERTASNAPRLLTALRDAAGCADAQSTRYALSCLLLSGIAGRIAATDSHRLLVQHGFAFPWSDDVLVPSSPVFASRELNVDEPILVGRSDDWVTLSTGPWTVHLRIEKESRFPRLDAIIPDAANAESVLRLGEDDCGFLLDTLPKLPGDSDKDSPVTCDLNGRILIRGQSADQPKATELVLANSRLDGPPKLVQTNRQFLLHAVRMGFRAVHLFGPTGTVLCEDAQRQFVWMLLGTEGSVPPDPDAIRLESPRSPAATPSAGVADVPRRRRRLPPMPTPASPKVPRHTSDPETDRDTSNDVSGSSPSPIEQLVALRDALNAAVRRANEATASRRSAPAKARPAPWNCSPPAGCAPNRRSLSPASGRDRLAAQVDLVRALGGARPDVAAAR